MPSVIELPSGFHSCRAYQLKKRDPIGSARYTLTLGLRSLSAIPTPDSVPPCCVRSRRPRLAKAPGDDRIGSRGHRRGEGTTDSEASDAGRSIPSYPVSFRSIPGHRRIAEIEGCFRLV